METKKEDDVAGPQGGMPTNMSTPRMCAHLNLALVTSLILQHTIKTNLFHITS